MNSITGFSVLKKPFSWKFSKYSKFSKKMKLNLNEKEGGVNKEYWEGGSPSPTDSTKEDSQESASFSWDFSERWPSSEEEEKFSWEEDDDCVYSTPSSSPHQRSPDEDSYPLYENGDVAGISGCMREEIEPIYESVTSPRSPVNLFLSLVGSQETVSPDPNIYEVPPGAIFNQTNLPEASPNNITPPNEFQDDLSERNNVRLKELSPKLEDLYSQVNKPRPKMETTVQNQEEVNFLIEEVMTDCESSPTEPEDYASASESELEVYDIHDNKNCEDPLKKNIGAQIMEQYEVDKKKVIASLDLPEVTILDVDDSIEDIEKERRRIIDNQVVKKKRIDFWIKESGVVQNIDENYSEEGVQIVEVTSDDEELPTFQLSDNEEATIEQKEISSENEGEIVYDSILQNKEKTKNYWEKLMLATKLAAKSIKKAGMEETGKVESVVEREIRLQREREEALALERQNALKLAKYNEDGLGSIPTTDEGNFSECSEEKDQSLDSSGDTETVFNYRRTPSFESMSSGHSSGSDVVTKRKAILKNVEDPRNELHLRIRKETPVEKDIRISKEREDDSKPKPKQFNLNTKKTIKKLVPDENRRTNDNQKISSKFYLKSNNATNSCKDEIRAELESISLKKCVSMSNLPMASHTDGNTNTLSNKPSPTNAKQFRQTTRQSSSNETASKIFTPSQIPRGLMKRFIESHGRLPASFVVSPSTTIISTHLPTKINISTEALVQTPVTPRSQDSSTPLRRPGYRSAEDKIQMELKEMKRRETELKQERARLLGRSQPNLLNIGLDDLNSDEENCSLPQMGKLRSALSNPNLTNERMIIIPKRCNELIDAWENMIQQKSEDY